MARTSLVLLGIALLLLGFIVFFERNSLSTTELEGRKGRVLESFVRQRVKRVELQRSGVTTVLVFVAPDPNDQYDAGGWRVEQPYKAKADKNEVDDLLGALEWAEARRSLGDASKDELTRFGLETPRYRVSYDVGNEHAGFTIGNPAADGGGAYLRLRDRNAVYVVGKELTDVLDHPAEQYHDKNLHEGVTVHTLERISLVDAAGAERQIARRDELVWLERPYVALASMPEVTSLMNALDSMRASHYVGEKANDAHGLQTPKLGVFLDSRVYDAASKEKDKRKLERLNIRVGGACAEHAGESYLQVNEGTVYCVADTDWQKLQPATDALRETRLLPVDDSLISGVSLREGTRELTLESKDDETRFSLKDNGKELQNGLADKAALADWYGALHATKIERFALLEASERERIEKHALRATFSRGKEHSPYLLNVARTESGVVGTRMNEASLLTLPADAPSLLSLTAARFRKKRVLDENEANFSALTLTRPDGVERVVKDASGYALAAPASGSVPRAPVDEILRLTSKLDALGFVADAARPEHGLATPYRTLRVEYTADGKTRTHTLTLGAPATDGTGRYAKLDDDAAVFVVANALASKLEEPLALRAR